MSMPRLDVWILQAWKKTVHSQDYPQWSEPHNAYNHGTVVTTWWLSFCLEWKTEGFVYDLEKSDEQLWLVFSQRQEWQSQKQRLKINTQVLLARVCLHLLCTVYEQEICGVEEMFSVFWGGCPLQMWRASVPGGCNIMWFIAVIELSGFE